MPAFFSGTWIGAVEKSRRIRLLGTPAILDGTGQVCELRGHQAWAVLARVLLAGRPLDRRHLAGELFAETADPLGTLRWCLAALRRALDAPTVLRGDPILADLPGHFCIDVRDLENGRCDWSDCGELLEGVDIRAGLSFSTWLLVERQRLAVLHEEQLRRDCLSALARGDIVLAAGLAERGVRRSEYDEAMHVLLVKSLVAAGRFDAALAHVEATERSFQSELGVLPSPALRSAARRSVVAPAAGVSPRAHTRSLLEAGKAALGAGAADAGIETLRRAASEASELNEASLEAEVLLELGTALVHAVRGYDEEGAILLRQSAQLATDTNLPEIAAGALRELGYVEAMAGRRPSSAAYLTEAIALAESPERRAGIQSVVGFNLVDWGRLEEGISAFRSAIDLARSAGNRRRWCLGIGARGLLAAQSPDEALAWLEECRRVVDELRWVSFRPWCIALRAEALLALGSDPASLRPDLDEAFAMSCELKDPCWEGATGRAIASTYEAEGNLHDAMRWLGEALGRMRCDVDRFTAQQVDILEDQSRVRRKMGHHAEASHTAQEWIALAARAHMDASIRRATSFITSAER
ncbi:MAG: BTAD domain-containing putative transcriptional regulator [Aestuariivirga sp.]